MMNLIKKAVFTLFIASSLSAANVAFAEDAKANEVIGHIEAAIAEIGKHDFNAAFAHEKAARFAAEGIAAGHEAAVKQGVDSLIKAQIIGKNADEEKAVAELNKALSFFKSI